VLEDVLVHVARLLGVDWRYKKGRMDGGMVRKEGGRTIAGGDAVDANPRCPLGSEAFGQIDNRSLGRVVEDLIQKH